MGSPEAIHLAATARHWSVRPSQLLGVPDEVTAYALDEALRMVEQVAEARAMGSAMSGLPPDQQLAPDSVYDDGPPGDGSVVPSVAELAALEAA